MRFAELLIEKYLIITHIVGTIIIAWILSAIVANSIGLFLPGPAAMASVSDTSQSLESGSFFTKTVSVASYMPICERNIFDSQKRTECTDEVLTVEPEIEDTPDMSSAPIKSDLPVELLGTVVSTTPTRSFATLSKKGSGESSTYYIGDSILDEAKIYEIERNRVFFTHNRRREYVEIALLPNIYGQGVSASPTESEGIKRTGDRILIARSKLDATLGDLNKVIQQSRMVPNFKDGVVDGFKIFAIRQGSIFEQLGLKNGDVIQEINGAKIDSVEKALPMLQVVQNESHVSIGMTRQGAKKTLTIDIQ